MAGNKYDEKCTYFDQNTSTTSRTTEDNIKVSTYTNPQTTGGTASSYTYPNNRYKGEVGWICPKCGRGMAPWKSYCDCGDTWTITCANKVSNPHSTGVDFNPDWSQVTCGDIDSGGGYIYRGNPPKVTLTN